MLWDMLFQKSYYTASRDELEEDVKVMKELEHLGEIYNENIEQTISFGSIHKNCPGSIQFLT